MQKIEQARETQELVSFQHGDEEEWSESGSFDWSRGIMWRRNAGAVIQTPFRGRKEGRREGGRERGGWEQMQNLGGTTAHMCIPAKT